MKIIKTKGIVISEHNTSDFDKMLTILTPNLGKIECIAKGARRPKSLLLAGAQFLCFGEYVLYKMGDIYSINSCDTIELFYNLRTDFDKLKYATLITKIINDVSTENQNMYKVLQLYLNTLYVMANMEKDLELVYSIFSLRLLSIIGFRPNIEKCKCCETTKNLNFFSIKDNSLKCDLCSKQDGGAIELSETARDAIIYIIKADAKKIFSFNITEEAARDLKLITRVYLTEKLEKEYKL